MVSVRFLCTSLERLGVLNLNKEIVTTSKKRTLQDMIVLVHYSIVLIIWSGHLLCTVMRSVRHSAEFTQAVLEDCFLLSGLYFTIFLRVNKDQLDSLITFMENSFSKADKKIIALCEHKCKVLLTAVFVAIGCSALGAFLESFLPMSEKDVEIRRLVYRTQHPERRHPYNVHYPFIDESESWAFELVLMATIYFAVVMQCFFSVAICILPFIMLNVRSQYEILAKYIVKIGVKHRDHLGNEIFYTNIETNEVRILTTSDKAHKARKIYLDKNALIRRQLEYEQNYLKQIIQFHQKLLIFHDKVCCLCFSQIIMGSINPFHSIFTFLIL
ncbi:hypothetical protein WDU94_007324 [Cyamophila willieti]